MVRGGARPHDFAMTTDQLDNNKHLVEAFIQDLFTKGDLEAVNRYLSDDFVNHDPPFPGAPGGADGFRQAGELMRRACPDWHSDVDQLVAEADTVVEVFTASGTHHGELMGVPGTGKPITLRGINVFRIDGDRVAERWGSLDHLGLLEQLGLAPAS
jgi:steroid delta-isomerase-like uncharacterized protein